MASMSRADFLQNLKGMFLDVPDYCPNGLQIEGSDSITKLVTGVTASQRLIDAAIEAKADAILVHHGLFWKSEPPELVGWKYRRVSSLIHAGINLFAYHLPLDLHPTLGNNVQLARVLDFEVSGGIEPIGDLPLVYMGQTAQAMNVETMKAFLSERLNHSVVSVKASRPIINKVAWCTGSADRYLEKAAAQGCDAFITGEISEPAAHLAQELNIHLFAAGHHATERYGVQAVGAALAQATGIEHQFIDCPVPV